MNADAKVAVWLALLAGCTHPPPVAKPVARTTATAPVPVVGPPVQPVPLEAHRESVGHGWSLYLPEGFAPKDGHYDLVVHFHGEGRFQERNVVQAGLAAAVVSVNMGGLGTEPYAKAFRSPDVFPRLLAAADAAIARKVGSPAPKLGRLALSAWSAGYSSVAAVLGDTTSADRIDAILLADGLFTAFSDRKKRTVNDAGLDRIVRFAERAKHDEKLFVLTHGAIPTGPYPSVQECTTRLLERVAVPKAPATGAGPLGMKRTYVADAGSFHVAGFDGMTAGDHVKELHAMGESAYPYLEKRWNE